MSRGASACESILAASRAAHDRNGMAIDSLGAPPRTAPQEPPPPLNRHLCQGNPFLSQEPFPARNIERSIVCETAKEPFVQSKPIQVGKIPHITPVTYAPPCGHKRLGSPEITRTRARPLAHKMPRPQDDGLGGADSNQSSLSEIFSRELPGRCKSPAVASYSLDYQQSKGSHKAVVNSNDGSHERAYTPSLTHFRIISNFLRQANPTTQEKPPAAPE